MQGIFYACNIMEKAIEQFKRILGGSLPACVVKADAPARADGNWWLDVSAGRKRLTLEYRPGKGFGFFHADAGYGEGPAEIYRTPELAATRLEQLLAAGSGKNPALHLKDIRELYGISQERLAKKVGIKQSAISRFEQRDEVKLSTLAAAIKALGGRLEVRARFLDSDVPITLSTAKR
jgi:DNA-binding XRE family transcriptional regulator